MQLKLQALPPEEAHFCLHICQFLEEMQIDLQDKKILVAFSAGLDSTALAVFLKLMQERYNLQIKSLHINHSIREEAQNDASHAENIAKILDIEHINIKEDVPARAKEWKKGLEEAGRIVRYKHFEEIINEQNFDFIALGHHLNDLAEDSLMRQIRGTSLEESFGMSAIDLKRKILRPFLTAEKARLEQFVRACNITWVEDSTNNSNDYLRNRVRNTLLPLILEENPNYLNTIANNWRQGLYDKEYWQEKIFPFTNAYNCSTIENGYSLDRALFSCQKKALRLRILADILKESGSIPESRLLFKIDNLALSKESKKEVSANNKLVISIKRDTIDFIKGKI